MKRGYVDERKETKEKILMIYSQKKCFEEEDFPFVSEKKENVGVEFNDRDDHEMVIGEECSQRLFQTNSQHYWVEEKCLLFKVLEGATEVGSSKGGLVTELLSDSEQLIVLGKSL